MTNGATIIELDATSQQRLLTSAVSRILAHREQVGDLPVERQVPPSDLRRRLSTFDLESGTGDVDLVVARAADLLEEHGVLTSHPRHFGLFNPTPLAAGIAADILTAGFNPQLAVWNHAPGAVEIEAHVVRTFGRWLGMPEAVGSFTSGGAEANATAVLLALQQAAPEVAERGLRALGSQPVMYASTESHLAWLKIAQQTGIGRDAVRLVPVTEDLKLDVDRLQQMIEADRRDGCLPFLVVGTAGTTGAGVIDPLVDLGRVADEEDLWLHVDAAWAGAVAVSPVLAPLLAGVARADSVTVDPHKWLSVPMGAGMFLTPHHRLLDRVFAVSTSYMPSKADDARDPYTSSMQWSRRAAGLKLFLTLAVHGRTGYARLLEEHVRLGDRLRRQLTAAGWQLANPTPLPVVCAVDPARPDDEAHHRSLAHRVVDTGRAWVSYVAVDGRPAVRACVISHRTTEADVDALVEAMDDAREAVPGAPTAEAMTH
ncbi:aspartate aminotransferase family protein [Egicoccus sp. AB-alg2]|uniref:pyridoxal phosphate-dependent decarboxylase family protein n=1 Tax=Egicoccus sp. AB-alg2 TaxID=3242693 RepID=UPI00359D7ED9